MHCLDCGRVIPFSQWRTRCPKCFVLQKKNQGTFKPKLRNNFARLDDLIFSAKCISDLSKVMKDLMILKMPRIEREILLKTLEKKRKEIVKDGS